MKPRMLPLLAGLCLSATSALAFPDRIGVYGMFERHSEANPGTFTILMNQGYVGLHADVGIQVNGGAWTTYDMPYTGLVEGNSKWQFTPAAAFPAGATVKYYFHGWDDWGGHIYDNNNSQDYSFSVPGGGGDGVSWATSAVIPANGPQGMDLAACNGTLYAVWAERAAYENPETVMFAQRGSGDTAWSTPVQLASVPGGMTYPLVTASARGVEVLFGSNTTTRLILRPAGSSVWNERASVASDGAAPMSRYGQLRADDTYTYVAYDNFIAPETSRVRFRRIHKEASAWEAERTVFDHSSYKATIYIKDFEVRGQKVVLTTFLQGWYGGYTTPYFHESADGGLNWSSRTHDGNPSQVDMDAAGHVFYVSLGVSPTSGNGIFFASKEVGSAWESWSLFWPGTGSIDALAKIDSGLVAVSTRNNLRYFEQSRDGGATWSAPAPVGGGADWIYKDVRDGKTVHLLAGETIDSGNVFKVISSGTAAATPVEWIGNTYHWPSGSDLDSVDDLWINIESYPPGAASEAVVHYTVNGTDWLDQPMELAGQNGNNDWWHVNMGKFAGGTTVRYAVRIRDGQGTDHWDNNNTLDYRATIAGSVTVKPPAFWMLDPYRYDTAKFRANGVASREDNNSFGELQLDAGKSVVVVTRPVENGNGNLVQTSCSITGRLHYTTTPGNWSNSVTVTGVFHPAGLSNKPIFDYYTFDLGPFAVGTQVEFWLEAINAAGTTYAQNAGNDFDFTIARTAGDTDLDGLPDQWEMDAFGNLTSQSATNNPDLDGPTYFPIANLIEWALGLDPNVPNDSSGIKLLWSPAWPVPGAQMHLSYYYVNESNPLFGKPIYAHVGFNGWEDVFDTEQLGLNGRISRFQVSIIVPADATEINVCFHDNAGTWDNNGGRDWCIPLQPVASPATRAMASSRLPVSRVTPPLAAPAPASQSALEPGQLFFAPSQVLSIYDGLNGLLNGANGFRLVGSAADNRLGTSVAAASDVNGDGYDDYIVGAPGVNSPNFREGRAYVVYGPGSAAPSQPISLVKAGEGFQATGLNTDDQFGTAVAGLGDINGDGWGDVLFTAPLADPNGQNNAGAGYVVFGATNLPLNVNLAGLNGSNGFVLSGADTLGRAGSACAPAGDFNRDGRPDFLVAAEDAQANAGCVYLVYGAAAYPSNLNLDSLDGVNGIVFTGEAANHHAGHSVAGIGDFNGDGFDDILIGAHTAPDFNAAGRAYVVFGGNDWPATNSLAALDGANGFRIDGAAMFGNLGAAAAGCDLNGDGLADAAVGAPNLDEAYVIFGQTNSSASMSVTNLDGDNGFTLAFANEGSVISSGFGAALVGARRLNVDAFGDLLCGAPAMAADGRAGAGEVFAVFGGPEFPAVFAVNQLDGTNGFRLKGGQAFAEVGGALAAMADADGDGFDKILIGERLFDAGAATNAGAAYVVSPPGVAAQVLYRPEIITTEDPEGLPAVTWAGQAGVTYRVFTSPSLSPPDWTELTHFVSESSTNTIEHTADGSLFYRIGVER